MEIDIQLTLRGPLAYRLIADAAKNGEEPVTLLARSVDRMIAEGKLDTAENSRPPRPPPTIRMERQSLFDQNGRLRKALESIHDITQETKNVPCWQALQNIEATASRALITNPE